MNYYTVCNQQNLIEDVIIKQCTIDFMITELTLSPIKIEDHSFISGDTETEGSFNFSNKLLSIQLGNVNNLFFIAFQYLTENEKLKLLDFINSSQSIFIWHNAKFDLKFLRLNKMLPKNNWCTLNMEKLCYAGIEQEKGFYSLEQLCLRYFNVQLNKEVRGRINHTTINDTSVIYYALDDVKYLHKIVEIQINYFKKLSQYNQINLDNIMDKHTVVGLENRVLPAFVECEMVGLKPNINALAELKTILDSEFNKILDNIKEVVLNDPILRKHLITTTLFGVDYKLDSKGKMFKWSSAVQKLKALRLLFPEIESTEGVILYEYQLKHPIVPLLIEYSKLFKLKTSFIDTLPTHISRVTGRIHTEFNQILNTGRVSASKPNVQQIPKHGELGKALRRVFYEDNGYCIVGGDYSGCELGIIANFSGDPLWLNTINNGGDLHGTLAALTFDIDISEIKNKTPFNKNISYRDVQKSINFGLAYGMSEFKLANTMKVTPEVAKGIINKFFKIVPKVKKYLSMLGKQAVEEYAAFSAPPYYRIRRFTLEQNRGQRERAGKNHPIQGTNADMTKLAMVKLYEYPKDKNIRLMLPVHDEILTRCPLDQAEWWKGKQQELMEEAATFIVKDVRIKAECNITQTWGK